MNNEEKFFVVKMGDSYQKIMIPKRNAHTFPAMVKEYHYKLIGEFDTSEKADKFMLKKFGLTPPDKK